MLERRLRRRFGSIPGMLERRRLLGLTLPLSPLRESRLSDVSSKPVSDARRSDCHTSSAACHCSHSFRRVGLRVVRAHEIAGCADPPPSGHKCEDVIQHRGQLRQLLGARDLVDHTPARQWHADAGRQCALWTVGSRVGLRRHALWHDLDRSDATSLGAPLTFCDASSCWETLSCWAGAQAHRLI